MEVNFLSICWYLEITISIIWFLNIQRRWKVKARYNIGKIIVLRPISLTARCITCQYLAIIPWKSLEIIDLVILLCCPLKVVKQQHCQQCCHCGVHPRLGIKDAVQVNESWSQVPMLNLTFAPRLVLTFENRFSVKIYE